MSKQIDERVVSMQFDNARFERNVAESMNTLDKLKEKLNLKGASKGFDDIQAAANRVDVQGLSSSIDSVHAKFSALQVVGVTALANITNSAVNAAKRISSALLGSIISGGKARATNLENAHFQLQGLLKDEAQVSAVMKNVSDSVDGTAYSLDSAATVASQLAASGLRAGDKMFKSLRAVAGVAAMTNSSYDDIGRIFTQVAGQGRLMGQDLLSLSSRGMNAAATLGKYLNKSEAEVRDMVSKGKISFEIFSAAMDDAFGEHAKKANETFSGALSNIRAALARIGALFYSPLIEQNGALVQFFNTIRQKANDVKKQTEPVAKEVTDRIIKMVNTINSYASKINIADHFKIFINLMTSAKNVFNGFLSVLKPIGKAFSETFSAIKTDKLIEFTNKLVNLTSKLTISASTSEKLKNTFKGLFSVVQLGWTLIKAVASGLIKIIGKLSQSFSSVNSGILTATGSIGNWIAKVSKSINESNIFVKAINAIANALTKVIDKINEFNKKVKTKIKSKGFETFLDLLRKLQNGLKVIGSTVGKVFAAIGKSIGNAFKSGNIKSLLDLVNTGLFTSIIIGLKEWVYSFKRFSTQGSMMVATIKKLLNTVRLSLEVWQKVLKADVIKKIAISIGILAASLWVLSGIDPERLGSALTAITVLFINLMGAMKSFDKLGTNLKGVGKASVLMISMSVSILILASAVKKLSGTDWPGLAKGILGVVGLLGALTAAVIALSKFTQNSSKIFNAGKGGLLNAKTKTNFIQIGLAMIAMATAIKILSSACKDLSGMNWDELGRGITGIIGLMSVMTISMIALSKFAGISQKLEITSKGLFSSKNKNQMVSIGLAMIAMAAAMKILASAAKDFSAISWEGLGKAGAAIGSILALVAGFNKLSESVKSGSIKNAISLVILCSAMEIFANVCSKFSKMTWPDLGKAGAAIAGILVLTSGFALVSQYAGNMGKSVICLTVMAIAMEIFANVCNKFASMDWTSLAKAGAAIGGILLLAEGFSLLSSIPGNNMAASAASLLLMAMALKVLTPVITKLGAMSWSEIIKGLVSLAAAFAIIGIAGAALQPVLPAILGLSGAIALLGIGCLTAGIGISAFAAGLLTLSTLTAASATAIVTALNIIIVGTLEIIPNMVKALTDAVVALCQVFIQSIPAISEAISVLLVELAKVLVECAPVLADGALKMLVSVLESLVNYTPQLVNGLVDLLIALIDALGARLPDITSSLVNFLVILFNAIGENIEPLINAWVQLFGKIFEGIATALGPIIKNILAPILKVLGDIFVDVVAVIAPYIPTICDAVTKITEVVSKAITNIVKILAPYIPSFENMINNIISLLKLLVEAIVLIIQQIAPIIDSITRLVAQLGESITLILLGVMVVIQACGDLISDIFGGIADVISSCGDAIRNSLDGIADIFDSVFNGISDVVNSVGDSIRKVLDGISNIIDSIGKAALNAGEGFKRLAEGVKTITKLNLLDMTASLGAVAIAIGKITKHSKGLANAGKGMKQLSDGVKVSSESFNSMASGIEKITGKIASSLNTIKGKTGQFISVGENLVKSLINGLNNEKESAKKEVKTLVSTLVSTIKSDDQVSKFVSAGKNCVTGFANGIRNNIYLASNAGSALGKAALDAAKKSLDEHSPSKEFYGAGDFAGIGFVNALMDNIPKAYNAGTRIADAAKNGISRAVSRLAEMVDSDIDTQPTIRPVLDLSAVRSGVGSMSALFTGRTLSVDMAGVGSLSASMSKIQNGNNSNDIVSSIKDLRRDISKLPRNTYTINGVTYDDGSNVSSAVGELVRAIKIEERT